jgi:hypothetical protein
MDGWETCYRQEQFERLDATPWNYTINHGIRSRISQPLWSADVPSILVVVVGFWDGIGRDHEMMSKT